MPSRRSGKSDRNGVTTGVTTARWGQSSAGERSEFGRRAALAKVGRGGVRCYKRSGRAVSRRSAVDAALLARIKQQMAWEFDRPGQPEGFPAFPLVPIGRYTSDEFWALERQQLWTKVWVLAGRAEDIAQPWRLLHVRRPGHADPDRARCRRRGAGVLQLLPAPGGAGRAPGQGLGAATCSASTTGGPTTSLAATW